ncbi:hypothetical protein GCM10027348_34460 [Hymenobacter tenuis]
MCIKEKWELVGEEKSGELPEKAAIKKIWGFKITKKIAILLSEYKICFRAPERVTYFSWSRNESISLALCFKT